MNYREFTPTSALRPYVQLIWSMELDSPVDFGPPERIAPDGIVELVLHYRDPMAMRFSGEAFSRQPKSSIVSQTRRYIERRTLDVPVSSKSVCPGEDRAGQD